MPIDIVNNKVSNSFVRTVGAGERISIRILDADGTVKEEVCDAAVPEGKQMEQVAISYVGAVTEI
jgi:hypothetical protein